MTAARLTQRRIGSTDEVLAGLDELEQALRIILRTPLGSVPGRPGFGIDLTAAVDGSPLDLAPFLASEIPRAVRASDPRIVVRQASVVAVDETGRLTLRVVWSPASAPTTRVETTVAL